MSAALLDRARSATFASLVADLAPVAPICASMDDMRDAGRTIERWADPTWTGQHTVSADDGQVWRDFNDGFGATARAPLSGAGLPRGVTGLGTRDGLTFRLSISPGVVGLRTVNVARSEQHEPDRVLAMTREDLDAMTRPSTREVREWSTRSRANLVRRIGELDLSTWADDGGDLCLVTWTIPGPWDLLAPNGRAFKRLIWRMRRRWCRAGLIWRGIWKLELQGRGAPHLHALMRVPAMVGDTPFDAWLAATWADICMTAVTENCSAGVARWYRRKHLRRHQLHGTDLSFSTRNFSDPRRIALYFLGHSLKTTDGKEYQHIVPEQWQGAGDGPGRFWGYWGLTRASVEVDVSCSEADRIARALRAIARARARQSEDARRAHGRDPLVRVRPELRFVMEDGTVLTYQRKRPVRRRRRLRSLGAGGRGVGGFVLVNDGQALAYDVARLLGDPRRIGDPSAARPERPPQPRNRWSRAPGSDPGPEGPPQG